jgi:catalase (peroxidase I)
MNQDGLHQLMDEDKKYLMLTTDVSLLRDPIYKQYVEAYANDEVLWRADFANAFSKLLELGVRR